MSADRRSVLVTGADGFIGSHLVEALVRSGHSVRATVMYNSLGHWGWLDKAPDDIKRELDVVALDIRDPHRVEKATEGIDTVLHLASLIAIPYSYNSPDSYVQTNVQGTLNLLQSALKSDVGLFVHTSTSEVYGSAQQVPISEKHPVVGQSPYSATKIGADQMAESFYRSFELPVVTLRPFNTYGPRQSARAIIPTIITQITSGQTEIKLGSLTPTRDFTWVGDIVYGFLAATKSIGSVGEVINLGSGEEISIGDLVKQIARLMNKQVTVVTDAERVRPDKSEVDRLVCDSSKAKEMLGWEPQVTLVEGLSKTIEWFSDPDNLSMYKSDRYNI